jgi:hypothetical protein
VARGKDLRGDPLTTTDVLGFAAFLLLPLFGMAIWRLDGVRRLDLGARFVIAGAVGALAVSIVLALLTITGIQWTRAIVIIALAIVAGTGFAAIRGKRSLPHSRAGGASMAAIGVIALVVVYGLLTARMSAGDLHFFWGPKSILFFQSGGVKLSILTSTIHRYMHPDYPLLLPLLYSWSQIVSRQFSWWAALLAAGVFVFGSVIVLRSTSGDNAVAVFMAAALGYTVARGYAAGAADPLLLLFETLTLCALVFIEDERTQTILAALGLAGAAATKIEGATFAIAVVIALIVVKRDLKRAVLIGAPAGFVVAGWLWFVTAHDIANVYHGGMMPIFMEVIPQTLVEIVKAADYGIYWLPWLAAIALIAAGSPRRAALPIVVTLLTTAAAVFFYIHVPDPSWWIASSAPRVLLTPLCCLLIAAAASRPSPPREADAVC